jgi:predicted nucleic acid-binding protein
MTRGDLLMVDTNILLTATNAQRTGHLAANRVFQIALDAGVHLATCGQILREYLVVATRPASQNGLGLFPDDALKNLEWFRKRHVYLEEPESVHHILAGLVKHRQAVGKRIHDLNIIALMKEHRIRMILTENPEDLEDISDIEILRLEAFVQ